jgi:hypothetical protein
MTCGPSGLRRACAYTISPYVHATFSAFSTLSFCGFQSGNFLKALRLSLGMGSVANAVAWLSRSFSMKRYWRMPFRLQAAAAERRESSSGTEHTTKDETSSGLPKRMPASCAAWAD